MAPTREDYGRDNDDLKLRRLSQNNINIGRRKSIVGAKTQERAGGSLHTLAVPVHQGRRGTSTSKVSGSTSRSGGKKSTGSVASAGSSGGSSGGGSHDSDNPRKRRGRKSKKSKNQKDNLLTRLRDSIAESDVFVAQRSKPVHMTSVDLTLAAIPPFTVSLIWDQLAVAVFQVPHLSMLEHPGFMLVFQFVCILFAMYGYCVQYVTTGGSRYVTLAKVSLVAHYILFGWRVFMELFYDGYRYQEKSYLPRDKDTTPQES